MKKQLLGFLTGVIVSALIFTTVPALAAQIQTITASINTVNIALDGKQVAAKGESYMLDNGTQVPYSLSYNGTTYLPMRKVGELVGKDIYWDATTGTAGVGKEPAAQTPTAPDTTVANDYSNWTAEEEAAYQEFKGMWEVSIPEGNGTIILDAKNKEETRNWWDANSRAGKEAYALRVVEEVKNNYSPDIPPNALFRISQADNLILISTYESRGVERVWE